MFIVTLGRDRALQRRATVRREELPKRPVALLPYGGRLLLTAVLYTSPSYGGPRVWT
jgi:hypothetical protein